MGAFCRLLIRTPPLLFKNRAPVLSAIEFQSLKRQRGILELDPECWNPLACARGSDYVHASDQVVYCFCDSLSPVALWYLGNVPEESGLTTLGRTASFLSLERFPCWYARGHFPFVVPRAVQLRAG